MTKRILHKKPTPATPEKPQSEHLFFLQIPADSPQMSPDVTLHLGLAAGHFEEEINNLDTVENLAAIDEENSTVRAISFGIVAVLENLREIHRHFTEVIELIKPTGQGGAQ